MPNVRTLCATLSFWAMQSMAFAGAAFAAPMQFSVGIAPLAVCAGDFNGDGKPDIACANFRSASATLLFGDGSGALPSSTTVTLPTYPYAVRAADMNGDGRLDLVASGFTGVVSVVCGNDDGTFLPTNDRAVGGRLTSMAINDFNSDGRLDVVCSQGDVPYRAMYLQGAGNGTFSTISSLQPGAYQSYQADLVAADFNGDGMLDLALSQSIGYYGAIAVTLGSAGGSFLAPTTYKSVHSPSAIVAGDFNRDGNVDIVTASADPAGYRVRLGTGTGTFGPEVVVPVGVQLTGISAGDIDGDSIDDLVLADINKTSEPSNRVYVAIGCGDGTFRSPAAVNVGPHPVATVIQDMNGDGRRDIVSVNYGNGAAGGGSISVSLNLGPPAAVDDWCLYAR